MNIQRHRQSRTKGQIRVAVRIIQVMDRRKGQCWRNPVTASPHPVTPSPRVARKPTLFNKWITLHNIQISNNNAGSFCSECVISFVIIMKMKEHFIFCHTNHYV